MDVSLTARSVVTSQGATDMAELRRCIGSPKFGIEPHEAPVDDFPTQPSQKDGLGRMCKTHWNQYTTALRKVALARKTADGEAVTGQATIVEATPPQPEPAAAVVKGKRVARRGRRAETVAEVEQEPPTS
jgi:hypothetical protein